MFASRLKNILEKKNISQTKLSEEIGCTQATISNWCSGITEPDFETLKYIANRLNVTIDYLLGNDYVNNTVDKLDETDKKIIKRYLSMTDKKKKYLLGIMNVLDENI